ncbi:uncharacterized protein [Mytilus edulis]|uniref:uncharacterized protein isoform X1 n=1 Tax=Mytilus edulis TaxID=6550 RepID=UPI0039F0E4BE
MLLTVALINALVVLASAKNGDDHKAHVDHDLACFATQCQHDELCRVSNMGGTIDGQCMSSHPLPHGLVFGCPQTLLDGNDCFCNTHDCIQQMQTHINPQGQFAKAGHHSLTQCGDKICKHGDEICKHEVNKDGRLHSHCIAEKDATHHDPNPQFGCTTLPTEHHPCYCRNDVCNTNLYNNLYQQNQVQAHHQELLCGDHVCHGGHQRCVIEESWDQHLHLRCEDHKDHHTPHCLPNLLSAGKRCFCDTRICVDHTLISLVSGHQVTGLICADHDDHVCHANQVCEIFHDLNGHFKKHCVNRHTGSIECQHLPHFNHRCICTTQQCVFGQFTAPTTAAPTTAQPITVQPTTVMQTNAPTTAVMSNSSSAAAVNTTNQPTASQTNAPTTAMLSNAPTTALLPNSSATPMLSNTSTILMMNSTTVVPSTTPSCADDEDANFSCVMYEMMYNLCTAATGTLHAIAHKRCRSYCKICTSGGSTSGPTSAVSLPTQATCIDHDVRCSQYQVNICGASVSQAFVISTCAKTCNKCAEYFASLQVQTAPTTTAAPAAQPVGTTAAAPSTQSITCNTCGDIDQLIPCYSRDVYGNSSTSVCPAGYDYCMTDVYQDTNGNTDVFKRCVTKQVCDSKWTNDSATHNYCTQYGVVNNPNAHECHFCCTGDLCNVNMKPSYSSLV